MKWNKNKMKFQNHSMADVPWSKYLNYGTLYCIARFECEVSLIFSR